MENNNQNNLQPLQPPPMIPPAPGESKWYYHKGLIIVIILILIAGLTVWFYTNTQRKSGEKADQSNPNLNQNQLNNKNQIRGFGQIKTVAPAADEKWVPGNKYTIKWQADNLSASSKIKITLIPVVSQIGAESNTSFITTNSGIYELPLPQSIKSGAYWVQIDEIKPDNSEGLRDRSVQIIITQTQENASTPNSGLANCGYIPADKFDPKEFKNPDYRKAVTCMSTAWQNCSPAEYSETNTDGDTNNFKIIGRTGSNCMIKAKTTLTNESYACMASPAITAELLKGTQEEKDASFLAVQLAIGLSVTGTSYDGVSCVKQPY